MSIVNTFGIVKMQNLQMLSDRKNLPILILPRNIGMPRIIANTKALHTCKLSVRRTR